MARKVILDVDPGIDDAVAICMALFDPRLEVVAITATGGNVSPEQTTRNVLSIVEQLDPPRLPRIGSASLPSQGLSVDSRHIFGDDGLGNANLPIAELHQRHASEKVICDAVHDAPEEITIIALGPLTNIAKAFALDPQLPSMIGHLIIMGGTVSAPGNVTAAAEFNIFCDPLAARTVLRSPTTKTLVPLDTSSQLVLNYDLLDHLPKEATRCGQLLHKALRFMFRSHRQQFGQEGISLHDAVALIYATDPELFETEEMACDVETSGEITTGATVFDLRPKPTTRPNMDVAVAVDTVAAYDCLLRSLARAGKLTS